MDKKLVAGLIAATFVAGIVLTWIFFSLGGRISGFEVFGIKGELPTAMPRPTNTPTATSIQPVVNPTTPALQISPSTTPALPTSTPVPPTLTPTTSLELADLIVSSAANNGVLFTAPADGNYQFTIKEGVYCTEPDLCRSIIRGYLGREIVWGSWYGLPHPMEQDYELGCWEDRTAQNPNCGVGHSTIISMKAQQYIRWVIMEDKNAFADDTGYVVLAITKIP